MADTALCKSDWACMAISMKCCSPRNDAVLIATGDRWHTMASIRLPRPGKTCIAKALLHDDLGSRALAIRSANTTASIKPARSAEHRQLHLRADLIARGNLATGHRARQHAGPATSHHGSEEPCRQGGMRLGRVAGSCPWRPFNKQYITGGWRASSTHGGASWSGAPTVDLANGPLRRTHDARGVCPEGSGVIATTTTA